MYIDGVKFCNVLEDTDRGLTQDMPIEDIQKAKVYGKTAIPTGTYKVTLDIVSPKFSKYKQYKFTSVIQRRIQMGVYQQEKIMSLVK